MEGQKSCANEKHDQLYDNSDHRKEREKNTPGNKEI